MAMAQSPNGAARARYNASFNSTIFEPALQPLGGGYVPAGKRRDQSTSEMFGSYAEKDLKSCPKTFIPKEDGMSARAKKQQFFNSDVLPRSRYPAGMAPELESPPRHPGMEADTDETIDPNLRRQVELSSKLFGRETPASTAEQVHDSNTRLTPNDFKWHNHPEPTFQEQMSHTARAYQEKCSTVFDHRSPNIHEHERVNYDADKQTKEDESLADAKRRANAYYSDLFGRETPMDAPGCTQDGSFHPKLQGSHEDQITVHRDWTDSKTELMSGARGSRPEHPLLRKSDELHQTRIFHRDGGGYQSCVERPGSVTHDNSGKVKNSFGDNTSSIHQAHLRSSMTPDGFYEEARNTVHWECVELHVAGLSYDADEARVRRICQGCDLQIVKVAVDMDPVRNLCKGRAKIMVRYNPKRDSIESLVQNLEQQGLKVEL